MTVLRRLVCCLVAIVILVSAFALTSVSAAGVDDGVLSVIEKNSKKYFGEAKSNFCTEYVSANGDGSGFYRYENIDLNEDSSSNVADLVALNNAILNKGGTDLNFDSSVDAKDLEILRKTLIGINDFEIK